MLVGVGAPLRFQVGRGRRLVDFLLERVPHLWQQDVDNLLLRWLDNDCEISSDVQEDFVFDCYFFLSIIGICVKIILCISLEIFIDFPAGKVPILPHSMFYIPVIAM